MMVVRVAAESSQTPAAARNSVFWYDRLDIPAERFRLRFDIRISSQWYSPDIYGVALSWDL
jgi:hypothetical protein